MNAFFFLILYVCINVVCIALCCHYSDVKRLMKIIGSVCLIPFIYVFTSSLVPNKEFADPLAYITIPILWIGLWLFFYKKKLIAWTLCILFTVAECYLHSLCHDKLMKYEEEMINEYRLEKYRTSQECRDMYD